MMRTNPGSADSAESSGYRKRPPVASASMQPGAAAPETPSVPATYPGARAPDRTRKVDAWGIGIAVHEWGDAEASPLLLAHGGFDFARTFDVFAPCLADGGWRVVAWDQRGHGDSEHAALYSFEADLRDAAAVLDSTTTERIPFVGHSKGGSMMMRLATTWPHRVTKVVNLDGVPSGSGIPDVPDHERTKLLADELTGWLDHRRGLHDKVRKPGTLQDLAQRRARMNPRLDFDWLLYLASVGARRDPDGWRWKLDPTLRFGGFGPWRPEWALTAMADLTVPLLGLLAGVDERMSWGTTPEDVAPHAPRDALIEVVDTGHFIHIERPHAVADWVLEFLS